MNYFGIVLISIASLLMVGFTSGFLECFPEKTGTTASSILRTVRNITLSGAAMLFIGFGIFCMGAMWVDLLK